MEKYWYEAYVIDVYDGDTITAEVNLGFSIKMKMKLRLYGINAPEVRGVQRPEGLKSRDWLRSIILHKNVLIRTDRDKTGKYGRYLATIYQYDDMHDSDSWSLTSINALLVKNGFAEKREY
jgi:micrococcal nuclease